MSDSHYVLENRNDDESNTESMSSNHHSYDDEQQNEHDRRRPSSSSSISSPSSPDIIALFGATSLTGGNFMKLALDAGYRIRALVPPSSACAQQQHGGGGGSTLEEEFVQGVTSIVGSLHDAAAVQEAVYGARFVVCMLDENSLAQYFMQPPLAMPQTGQKQKLPPPTKQQQQEQNQRQHSSTTDKNNNKKYPKHCLEKFVKLLYPILLRQDDPVIQCLLWQANALCVDGRGNLPLFSKVLKTVATHKARKYYVQDLDTAIKYLHQRHFQQQKKKKDCGTSFPFLVTRPSMFLRNGPSTRKLAASKSVSIPFSRPPSLFLCVTKSVSHIPSSFLLIDSNLVLFLVHILMWQNFHCRRFEIKNCSIPVPTS